jgi:kynureninase
MITRAHAERLDREDPLAEFRDSFAFGDDGAGCIYLDGNSLGRAPKATLARLREATEVEWAGELIRGWGHWIDLARRAGDALAAGVVDARPGEVIVSDSTSVNLYKLSAAALDARPGRGVIVTDDDNFPTDQYVLAGLAEARGLQVRRIKTDIDTGVTLSSVVEALDSDVALVSLSHVAYRSGAIADMSGITAATHQVGALALWDLCHSAGSVPVPLKEANVDLAVGCTYKHLNAGPGAPAFLYVRSDLQTQLRQPIWGWFGQRDQFGMASDYDPVASIERFLVGTPPIFGLYGVIEGTQITAAAGIDRIFQKAQKLTNLVVSLYDAWLSPLGFTLASPRQSAQRGAHVTLHHKQAWQICQAWQAEGVIGDFRTPERLRIGPAPLYTRYTDVFDALARLRELVLAGRHEAYPTDRSRVT